MRHTLIPPSLRKDLHHEYRVRASIVFLFMFSMAWIVGTISLLPSFVHVMNEKIIVERSFESLKSMSNEKTGASVSDEIAKQANVLSLFDDTSQGITDNSSLIESIVDVREDVKISSMSVSRTGTTTVLMFIQGVAPDRDSLVAFKGRLESATPGNMVNLPVSELAKSKDIQFSLTLMNEKTP